MATNDVPQPCPADITHALRAAIRELESAAAHVEAWERGHAPGSILQAERTARAAAGGLNQARCDLRHLAQTAVRETLAS